jgi:hypothetical protein
VTFQLGSDLDYDIIAADGTYDALNQGTPGKVDAGTWIDCYLLHADIEGETGLLPLSGDVTFDNPILGVIVKDSTLGSSDSIVGRSTTDYAEWGGTVHFRGLDFFEDTSRGIQDYITISGNTVTLDIKAGNKMDEVRVITGPTALEVQIDIKPGSYPNSINPGSNGVVPVAILGSETFDVTWVDDTTIALAGSGVAVKGKSGSKLMSHLEDVNDDGFMDLVVQVETEDLSPGELESGTAILTGTLLNGLPITGSDSIVVVPK